MHVGWHDDGEDILDYWEEGCHGNGSEGFGEMLVEGWSMLG